MSEDREFQLAAGMIKVEAEHAMKAATDTKGVLLAAMKTAKHHWMFTDEGLQQCAAIAATIVFLGLDHPDVPRIQKEIRFHQALSVASSGMPVDFDALMDSEQDELPAIGIAGLWLEA